MADISKIILPNNAEYDVKDTTARTNASTAVTTANSALTVANAAVPTSDYITTAEINQIWEAN